MNQIVAVFEVDGIVADRMQRNRFCQRVGIRQQHLYPACTEIIQYLLALLQRHLAEHTSAADTPCPQRICHPADRAHKHTPNDNRLVLPHQLLGQFDTAAELAALLTVVDQAPYLITVIGIVYFACLSCIVQQVAEVVEIQCLQQHPRITFQLQNTYQQRQFVLSALHLQDTKQTVLGIRCPYLQDHIRVRRRNPQLRLGGTAEKRL